MLLNLKEYHRPESVEGAVTLLRRGPDTVALAGGSKILASGRRDVRAVVDLGDLSLDYVRAEGTTLYLGATTTLQQLIDTPDMQTFAGGLLAETARAVAGRNVRNAATLGGTVAGAGGRDPLLTALLALDAKLTLFAPQARQIPLVSFLAYRERLLADGALIIQLTLPLLIGPLGAAYVAVGRTPRDYPIVCAVARMELAAGVAGNVRLALGGVAPVPARADGAEQLLERKRLTEPRIAEAAEKVARDVEPAGDYMGSAEYRREMARVLAQRALSQARARAQALGDQRNGESEA